MFWFIIDNHKHKHTNLHEGSLSWQKNYTNYVQQKPAHLNALSGKLNLQINKTASSNWDGCSRSDV